MTLPAKIEHQDLEVYRPPEVVLEEARRAARALKDVVDAKPHKVIINNEQYLEFEDWQTVGRFYGLSVKVTITKYIEFGDAKGFEASAIVTHIATGNIVSGAEAMCLNDEDRWANKPLFQLKSMAQTRACAKAFRNCLAWVVVLAGYKGTPAEEMEKSREQRGHWCSKHETVFFKKGKMKGYAHKIEGTDEWCNEETPEPLANQSQDEDPEDIPWTDPTEADKKAEALDRQVKSILNKLTTLFKVLPQQWSGANVLRILQDMGGTGKTAKALMLSLPTGKLSEFESLVNDDLKMVG